MTTLKHNPQGETHKPSQLEMDNVCSDKVSGTNSRSLQYYNYEHTHYFQEVTYNVQRAHFHSYSALDSESIVSLCFSEKVYMYHNSLAQKSSSTKKVCCDKF